MEEGDITGRRPGRPRLLDPNDIWSAALAIADRDGVDGLTLRKLAATLGVAPNAMYTYVPDRDTLLDVVADHVLAAVDLRPFSHARRSPRRRLLDGALGVRHALLAHPAAATIAARRPPTGPGALALGEAVLDALHDLGLAPRPAGRALYLLTVYVFGSVGLEVAEVDERPIPDETARVAARLPAFTAIPAQHYPRSAAISDVLAANITTTQFRWGLARIIDGISSPASSP